MPLSEKQMQKIYFAASISAGRGDQPIYEHIVASLKKYGTVATEIIGSPNLLASGEGSLTAQQIHDRDVDWLSESDIVVAEVTVPSLGVGYEIALATTMKKPVLCLFRPADGRKLSAMIAGCSRVQVRNYKEIREIPILLQQFFSCYDG